MGKGLIKRKQQLKKQYLKPLQDYCKQLETHCKRLEQENEALKGDPNTLIGQFIGQYRELHSQNSRLSVLAAALLDKLEEEGVNGVVSKAAMERFKDHRLTVKWVLPEGIEKPEDADHFIFSYEAILQEQPQAQPAEAEQIPECTDPECNLPKDLRHVHTPEPVTEATGDSGEQTIPQVLDEVASPDVVQEAIAANEVDVVEQDMTATEAAIVAAE